MKKLIASLEIIFLMLFQLAPVPALADSNDQIFSACSGNPNSSICQDAQKQKASGKNPINQYIRVATDIVAVLVGLAAVVMIIISGFKFITGGGSPESVKSARQTLIAAVIGLALSVVAWSLITFLVDKLIP